MVAHACNPSYLEAKEGELLEPRRQRLQLANIVLLHSSLGDRVTEQDSVSKKKRMMAYTHCSVWGFLVVVFVFRDRVSLCCTV